MPNYWLIPLVVAAALFMENMDGTVIATALPVMAADLNEDPVILKLAFTSYLLSLAVFIPVSGWVADRYGARHVFRAAILVFVLASIWCGAASSLPDLVAARAAQGFGGALMVPVGRLILLRSVPKNELVNALAYLTIPALIGPIIGPPLGGFIATYFHWRWIFWINVPVGILGIVLATLYMPDIRGERLSRLDVKGFFLSGLGLAAMMFGLTTLGRSLLPEWVAPVLMLAGGVLLVLYWFHQKRTADPMLDLKLFRIQTFRSGVLGGSLFRIGLGATPFLLPLMLQVGFGLDAFRSGLLTFAAALGAMAMKFTASRILRRYGFRAVLVVNAGICALSLMINGLFTPSTPHWIILGVLLVGGFFRSLQFTALNALSYADVARPEMSQATAIASVAQQLATSTGVALGALVLEIVQAWRGDETLVAADFSIAFFVMALLAFASIASHARLPKNAADEVAGRAPVKPSGE
ncbi:MAG: DHA2 family efflux MFS transporter permease subunit [Parvibaculaceae bacterium]